MRYIQIRLKEQQIIKDNRMREQFTALSFEAAELVSG